MKRLSSSWGPIALAALVAAAMPAPAAAGWPTPAGGGSSSGDPELVLTFDDGPHPRFTEMILDELEARNLQAIFFWVGRRLSRGSGVAANREVVERAVRAGHLVANHTMSHAQLCSVTTEAAAAEIDDAARMLEELTGLPILLFRAPYGVYCQRLRSMLVERNIDHLHWDIDPQEWTDHDASRTAAYVIRKLRHLRGRAVLLMHDTHLSTARALPMVLDWIDEENQRRLERGASPIRIVSGSDFLAERTDMALAGWAMDAALTARGRWTRTIASLVP